MVGRNRVVHSRIRAMLLRAAQARMWRRKRTVESRSGGKEARAERAPAGDGNLVVPEMMNQILGLLSPRDLCRARAVCKYWEEVVRSPNFVRRHAESPCVDAPTVAFLEYGHSQPVVGFDAELNRWVPSPAFFSHNKDTYLVAAAKGLYVYNVTAQDNRGDWPEDEGAPELYARTQLVVTNPWTGATKWLPLMLNECGPHFSVFGPCAEWDGTMIHSQGVVFTLDVVDNGGAYILTAVNPSLRRGEVYDSRLGHWTTFSAPYDPDMVNLSLDGENPSNWKCVRLMGSLYFMARGTDHNDVHMTVYLVSFNLETRKWGLVYEKLVKLRCEYEPWLTTCDNKLVVVDVVRNRGREMSGEILTVDVERQVLSHEAFMPRTLASALVVVGYDPASGDYGSLEVVSVGTGHLLHFFSSQDKLTTYDFHSKMWRTRAPSLLWPKYGGVMGQLVDVQLSLLPA